MMESIWIREHRSEVEQLVREKESWLIAIRREIHQHPERGMQEVQTSALVLKSLLSFGIEAHLVDRVGVIGVIHGGKDDSSADSPEPGKAGPSRSRCIGIRADMDALPVEEEAEVPFRSLVPGMMHACGHDVHTTALLGAAYVLQELRNTWSGTIKLLFQPAEESGKGAKFMMAHGALSEEPKPDALFALHCWPQVEAGKVFHRHGAMGAASDTFDLVIHGKSAHAAHPDLSVDPIAVLGQLIVALQPLISREKDPFAPEVLTISSVEAGRAHNTIPEQAIIKGAIRSLDEATRDFLHVRLQTIAEHVCAAFRATCDIQIHRGTPSSSNETQVSHLMEAGLKEMLGEAAYVENPLPSMGSEDFAYYAPEVPSAMYRLGVGVPGRENASLHSSRFDPDERALSTGVCSLVGVAMMLMEHFSIDGE